MLQYQALLRPAADSAPNESGYVVTFPDFDWGVTQGDTEQEAMEMAADALGLMIDHIIKSGEPLPVPGKRRGRQYRTVRLSALHTAKAELYSAFLASGIRKTELARRLGIPKANVARLFDLKHQSRLDQIEAAFHAVGKEVEITVRNAAA